MPSRSYSALIQGGWRDLEFEPFRHGVTIHWLEPQRGDRPSAAILKYLPGARVPRHRHEGLESIIVLSGIQSDEAGDYETGTLILNPAGTEHSVWSHMGCVVLIQWEHPVTLLEAEHQR